MLRVGIIDSSADRIYAHDNLGSAIRIREQFKRYTLKEDVLLDPNNIDCDWEVVQRNTLFEVEPMRTGIIG